MGGLGAFFYMSYFNSAAILILIVVFLLKIFYDSSANNVLGPSVRRPHRAFAALRILACVEYSGAWEQRGLLAH